jgi:threonine synthase
VVLVATSGDTGSAVARAFYRKENIQVVILYPSGRVSPLQEKQLTVLGENITALEVKGSFDDCQRMVKEAFMDPELRERLPLTSANSINLGRLIPQAFYYIYAYLHLRPTLGMDWWFCVPSGNFGNLTAGVYAWHWGMPVKGFIAATNTNDVVPEYLGSGVYSPRTSHQTLSNAMDVGNPSNFERLLSVFGSDWRAMRKIIRGQVVTDQETLRIMGEVEREHGIFLCPHTAVGYLASRRFLEQNRRGETQVILLATAHPAKFQETVKRATGREPALPEGLREALDLPKRSVPVENTLDAFRSVLLDRLL